MSWIRSTATDYLDLSDELVLAVAGNSVATSAINAAGTGYTVGDILSVAGGTGTVTAQVEVTAISGGGGTGPITAVRRYNDGVYTVNPSTPNSVTGGTGSSATVDLTFTSGNGWTVERDEAASLTTVDSVVSGGTGYSVDDIITLAGGVYTTPVQLKVATLSGSAVATVTIEDAGNYSVVPTDPVAQASVAPTGGSGATFNLTFDTGEKNVILKGIGGGTDAIYVGWRTFSNVPGGYYNWELHGMIGYNGAQDMQNQPGVSDGFYDHGTTANRAGCYLTLHNASIEYWLNISPYRIIGEFKIGSAYFPIYLGWGNRFATVTEYPYPIIVSGNVSAPFETPSYTSSALTDPHKDTDTDGAATGPMQIRYTDGTWYYVANSTTDGAGGGSTLQDRVVLPVGTVNVTSVPTEDLWMSATANFQEVMPSVSGSATAALHPTPGTTDYHVLLPTAILFDTPAAQVLAELDDVFWTSGFGSMVSENRIVESGVVYRVFQNCGRTLNHTFLAIKEA